MSDALLMLDEIDLLGDSADVIASGFWFETAGDEADFGNPEQAVTEVASQLLDGDVTALAKAGNREATVRVKITGADSAATAAGEALLSTVCDRPGLKALAFQHPDLVGAVTVFDVQQALLRLDYDDLGDVLRNERVYVLTLICKPWPRSQGVIEIEADAAPGQTPPVPPADVVWDEGTDASRWSLVSEASGSDRIVTTAQETNLLALYGDGWTDNGTSVWMLQRRRWAMMRSGPVPADPARPFLHVRGYVVMVETGSGGGPVGHNYTLTFGADGKTIEPARLRFSTTDGHFEAWLPLPNGVRDRWSVRADARSQVSTLRWTVVALDTVTRTAGAPSLDSPKIRHRLLPIEGTKPAEASVTVSGYDSAAAPAALGRWTLAYTSPSIGTDFNPSLARYRTDGPLRTTGAALLSGGYTAMSSTAADADTYTIPVTDFEPGTYQIIAHVAATAAGAGYHQVAWDATVATPGTTAADWPTQSGQARVWLPDKAAVGWDAVSLGEVTLPLVDFDTPPAGMSNVLRVWCPDGNGISQDLDTIILLNISTGQMTLVDTSGGQPVVGVRIDAPVSDRPQQTVWLERLNGTDTYTVAAGNRVTSTGVHRYQPGAVSVFTITAGNDYSLVTGAYAPRWLSFAGQTADEPVA